MKLLAVASLLTLSFAIHHSPLFPIGQGNTDFPYRLLGNGKWEMGNVAASASPLIFWQQGIETAAALKQAGIERIAVAPDKADQWRKAGFEVVPMTEDELKTREKLVVPGASGRPDLAAATGRPWLDANGWRFTRNPTGQFFYELPKGRAVLAVAESFAYNADTIFKIDPADLAEVGRVTAFLKTIPVDDRLPLVADIGVVDDGSKMLGEVMNLLSRRNLLFKPIKTPSPQLRLNIQFGTKTYPRSAGADPSEFAQTIRRRLTDDARTLRVYGSEVVIARLTGDSKHLRLHLLNYGRRDFEGMRIRLRGMLGKGDTYILGQGKTALLDYETLGQFTEFSLPRMSLYAVVDLPRTN